MCLSDFSFLLWYYRSPKRNKEMFHLLCINIPAIAVNRLNNLGCFLFLNKEMHILLGKGNGDAGFIKRIFDFLR
jgi:hypothetical protein